MRVLFLSSPLVIAKSPLRVGLPETRNAKPNKIVNARRCCSRVLGMSDQWLGMRDAGCMRESRPHRKNKVRTFSTSSTHPNIQFNVFFFFFYQSFPLFKVPHGTRSSFFSLPSLCMHAYKMTIRKSQNQDPRKSQREKKRETSVKAARAVCVGWRRECWKFKLSSLFLFLRDGSGSQYLRLSSL